MEDDNDNRTQTITQLVREMHQHKPTALQGLWNRLYPRLKVLARQRLSELKVRLVDEEDIAVEVLYQLHRGFAKGLLPRIANRDELWRLLTAMTRRKAASAGRRETAGKRGGGRVRNEAAGTDTDDARPPELQTVPGKEPTPSALVSNHERTEELFKLLGRGELREVAELKAEGYSNAEIAEKLQTSERTVERRLEVVRRVWKARLGLQR